MIYSEIIEKQVIASLLYCKEAYENYYHNITSEIFYDEKHRKIIKAIDDIKSNDIILIAEKTGLYEYICQIAENATSINLNAYTKILYDLYKRREYIKQLHNTIENLENKDKNTDDIMDELTEQTINIKNNYDHDDGRKPEKISDILPRFFSYMDDIHSGKKKIYKTGIYSIDNIMNGFLEGEYIVLGARPSSGKTSLAMQIALNNIKIGHNVLFFSLETIKTTLAGRILCIESNEIFNKFYGNIKSINMTKIGETCSMLINKNLWIDSTPQITPEYIYKRVDLLKNKIKFDFIIVDHMHLMRTNQKFTNRNDELTKISGGIKRITQETGIPILVLCQLSRGNVKSENYVPTLSDLRECGAIEADCDRAMLLHYPNSINKTEPNNVAQVNIAKNKTGKTGYAPISFEPSTTTFSDPTTEVLNYWTNYKSRKSTKEF